MAIAVPYSYKAGGTVSISSSTTTASTAIDLDDGISTQIKVYNSSSVVVFVNAGSSSVEADTVDNPIAPGAVEVISVAPGTTHVAAESISGSANVVYFTPVKGV